MFVVVEVLAIVALVHSVAEAVIVKTTNANENVTSTPLRLRLRWPGKNFRTSTIPTATSAASKSTIQIQEENVTTESVTEPENTKTSAENVSSSTENLVKLNEFGSATESSPFPWNYSTVPSIFSNYFFKIFPTETIDNSENKFSMSKEDNVTTTSPENFYQEAETTEIVKKQTSSPGYEIPVVDFGSTEKVANVNLFNPSQPKNKDDTSSSTKEVHVSSGGTYVYVVGIVGIIPTVGVFVWCIRHVMSRPQKNKDATPKTTTYSTVDVPTNESHDDVTAIVSKDQTPDKYDYSSVETNWKRISLEYPRHNLDLLEILGEGNFGVVWKAEAVNICESRHTAIVAVKTVKENAQYKERQELLRELSIMQRFDHHPNVVKLLGCCTETEPYFLIMEFVKNGKLQSFLREHRNKRKYYNSNGTSHNLTSRDLTMFAYQVALGMEYISSVGVIHRDLAARNILVDHNNNCKVADFGLSRYFEDGDCSIYEQKTKGALPIRWMAPESLHMSVFTTKSDVWAFGILLWEIVTLGSTPYPGMSAREVIHHVQRGNTMECPDHCQSELYSVMCACWITNPNCRPTFTVLCKRLENLLQVQAGYVDLDHFPENNYYNLYQSPGEKV
ncbi:tyrosine kinase receptor Cad96Ca-like [Centruroides vittatus]|uniref:tyrosine kinase receptor Cad96Ca-like n=1 Tax=Centruroides vittatus TaxID=120091 RepID=UPI00350F2242